MKCHLHASPQSGASRRRGPRGNALQPVNPRPQKPFLGSSKHARDQHHGRKMATAKWLIVAKHATNKGLLCLHTRTQQRMNSRNTSATAATATCKNVLVTTTAWRQAYPRNPPNKMKITTQEACLAAAKRTGCLKTEKTGMKCSYYLSAPAAQPDDFAVPECKWGNERLVFLSPCEEPRHQAQDRHWVTTLARQWRSRRSFPAYSDKECNKADGLTSLLSFVVRCKVAKNLA